MPSSDPMGIRHAHGAYMQEKHLIQTQAPRGAALLPTSTPQPHRQSPGQSVKGKRDEISIYWGASVSFLVGLILSVLDSIHESGLTQLRASVVSTATLGRKLGRRATDVSGSSRPWGTGNDGVWGGSDTSAIRVLTSLSEDSNMEKNDAVVLKSYNSSFR